MKMKELRTPAQLLVTAALAEAGLISNGAADGVSQNTASRFNADRMALLNSRKSSEDAKTLLRQHQETLAQSLVECRTFIVVGRDILKPRLGTRYKKSWDAAGMKGSLAAPDSADDIQAIMESFNDYFGANPAYEDPSLGITAANATTLLTALVAARAAVNAQKTVVGNLLEVRDEKADKLRKRVRGLVNELNQLLTPESPSWRAYGFTPPGTASTPDVVEGLIGTLIGPTTAALKWNAAARAEYYRVWMKVHGTDDDYRAMGSPADLDFTLENLPAGSTIDIVVTALNDGGESAVSEKITLTMHA